VTGQIHALGEVFDTVSPTPRPVAVAAACHSKWWWPPGRFCTRHMLLQSGVTDRVCSARRMPRLYHHWMCRRCTQCSLTTLSVSHTQQACMTDMSNSMCLVMGHTWVSQQQPSRHTALIWSGPASGSSLTAVWQVIAAVIFARHQHDCLCVEHHSVVRRNSDWLDCPPRSTNTSIVGCY
jgi:hypothetical protein